MINLTMLWIFIVLRRMCFFHIHLNEMFNKTCGVKQKCAWIARSRAYTHISTPKCTQSMKWWNLDNEKKSVNQKILSNEGKHEIYVKKHTQVETKTRSVVWIFWIFLLINRFWIDVEFRCVVPQKPNYSEGANQFSDIQQSFGIDWCGITIGIAKGIA